MLATNYESVKEGTLRYPKMGSPKLDGIRALVQNGVILSRNMKPIRNEYISEILSKKVLEGLDGELIVGKPFATDVFRASTSGVMSFDGDPDFKFFVFDKYHKSAPFIDRLDMAAEAIDKFRSKNNQQFITLVPHFSINNEEELLEYEKDFVDRGYEGMMLRCPDGLYKEGRATPTEQTLLKVKRFSDAEGIIFDYVEEVHGKTKLGKNSLGKFMVRDPKTGVEFGVGGGYTAEERQKFWINRDKMIGQMLKYKYFDVGMKDAPRFPSFLGIRDEADMS